MTIPKQIQDAYLAIAAGSKPHEREAAQAIVWAVAGWLQQEWLSNHRCATNSMWPEAGYCNDERHDWFCDSDWLAEAERLLRETEGKKDG